MNGKHLALSLLLSSALLVAGSGAAGAQPAPLGPETRVDTLAGDQFPGNPMLTVQRDGTFEIAWSYGAHQPAAIYVRHFNAAGRPTDASQVLLGSEGFWPEVDAIVKAGKGYDVLWHVIGGPGVPTPFYTRHLDARGVPLGKKPLKVGKPFMSYMWFTAGDGLAGGYYLSLIGTLELRKISPNGVPTLQERRINTSELTSPVPAVVPLTNGGFVGVIQGTTVVPAGGTPQPVLRARRFSGQFEPVGPDFDLNTIPAGPAGTPPLLGQTFAVAAAPDGGFGVAWTLDDTLYVRVFDAAGHAEVPESPVVTVGPDHRIAPASIAFDNAGNLLLLWMEEATEPLSGIPLLDLHLQLFNSRGVPLGPQEELTSAASGAFGQPLTGKVAWANGSWLVTWAAESNLQGPSAIFVRRFARQ
ncbi:MAG TPA: hypothetical protein VF173_01255 [Thermoanaerobaculia bacterium]|nr:hypothetical protein [Thermoanaerobaculia bacterium]